VDGRADPASLANIAAGMGTVIKSSSCRWSLSAVPGYGRLDGQPAVYLYIAALEVNILNCRIPRSRRVWSCAQSSNTGHDGAWWRSADPRTGVSAPGTARVGFLARWRQRIGVGNTPWLGEFSVSGGWPGRALAGENGAGAAWRLARYADRDPAWRRACPDALRGVADQRRPFRRACLRGGPGRRPVCGVR